MTTSLGSSHQLRVSLLISQLFILHLCYFRCGPCKFIGPIFEELARENPEAEFVKVDVDDADDVAAAVGIQAMPTFHFYKGGVKVDEMMGADQATLASKVAKNK
jgi:thioredoxin 1